MTTTTLSTLFRALMAIAAGCLISGGKLAHGQNVIRGAVPGWPASSGYYAPQNVYQFAPASAPVVQAQYGAAPTTVNYAPASNARVAYAAPAMGSYQLSYAGANQPGVSTTAYYGGHSGVQRVAYMAPQVYYRPVPVSVPVTYYRPYTVYQPAPGGMAVAPTTCQYATSCTTTTCGTSRSTCWRPFAWLWGGSCNTNSCNKPACGPTTCNYASCAPAACAPAGCGAVPYYTQPPSIPTVVAPSPFPRGVSPGVITTPTVPPPGTRLPGTVSPGGTIIGDPASIPPRIQPGTTIPTNPAPFNPGGGAPFGGSGTFQPGTGAPLNPGSFGSGGISPGTGGVQFGPDGRPIVDPSRRPVFPDPYSSGSTTESGTGGTPIMLSPPPSSTTPVVGSGYSSQSSARFGERATLSQPGNSQPENRPIVEPGMSQTPSPSLIAPPSSVQPLRDPHGDERKNFDNRAPQLIAPGDRTAQADQRWNVVPAVWPARVNRPGDTVRTVSDSPAAMPARHVAPNYSAPAYNAPSQESLAPVNSGLDDGGWKSAR